LPVEARNFTFEGLNLTPNKAIVKPSGVARDEGLIHGRASTSLSGTNADSGETKR
jgi:hypothetical protein